SKGPSWWSRPALPPAQRAGGPPPSSASAAASSRSARHPASRSECAKSELLSLPAISPSISMVGKGFHGTTGNRRHRHDASSADAGERGRRAIFLLLSRRAVAAAARLVPVAAAASLGAFRALACAGHRHDARAFLRQCAAL